MTSCSSMATSPATIASASVPANAAHVLRPMRALMDGAVLAQVDVRPADGDLVDRPGLLAWWPMILASAALSRAPDDVGADVAEGGAGAFARGWSIRSIAGFNDAPGLRRCPSRARACRRCAAVPRRSDCAAP